MNRHLRMNLEKRGVTYPKQCAICKKEDELVPFKNKHICRSCITEIGLR